MANETRIVAMGSTLLMEGFALVGLETWPDATSADVETVIDELLRQRQKALVLLESDLMRDPGPVLARAIHRSDHIIIAEIPSLPSPEDDRPAVEALIRKLLGPRALTRDEP